MRMAIWEDCKRGAFYLDQEEHEYLFNGAVTMTNRAQIRYERSRLIIRRSSAVEGKEAGSRTISPLALKDGVTNLITFIPDEVSGVRHWARMRTRSLPSTRDTVNGVPVFIINHKDISDCIAAHGAKPTQRPVEPIHSQDDRPAAQVITDHPPLSTNGLGQLKAAKDLFMEEFRKHPDAKLALSSDGELQIQIVTTVNL